MLLWPSLENVRAGTIKRWRLSIFLLVLLLVKYSKFYILFCFNYTLVKKMQKQIEIFDNWLLVNESEIAR